MNEEIIKRFLDKIENKKNSYKSTEIILFHLSELKEAIKMLDDEINKLEEENSKLIKPNIKSNHLILNENNKFYFYGDETLLTRIDELRQQSIKAKSQIRLVNKALDKIKEDKYYKIIDLYYFKGYTIEALAEELDVSTGSISMNKKRLINTLKVYVFPDNFINEL